MADSGREGIDPDPEVAVWFLDTKKVGGFDGAIPVLSGSTCGTIGNRTGSSLSGSGSFSTTATSCTLIVTGLTAGTVGQSCTLVDRTRGTGVTYSNVSSSASSATFPTIATVNGDLLVFSCIPW